VGRAALQAARDLVMAAIDNQPFDVAGTVSRLRAMVDSLCLGPSTAHIVDAATARGIPHTRLNDGNLVQLGQGVQQRRIWTAETDGTSAIAEGICSDKDLTKTLLATCGIPVPEGEKVDSPEAAWTAAQDIGLPVAVKPIDGNHGRGITLDLMTEADVHAAYVVANEQGSGVIVERCIPGEEHRLLVVGGRMVAATRGQTTEVVATANTPCNNWWTSNSTPTHAGAKKKNSRWNSSYWPKSPTCWWSCSARAWPPTACPTPGNACVCSATAISPTT
jgi:cyanophycin synthetase